MVAMTLDDNSKLDWTPTVYMLRRIPPRPRERRPGAPATATVLARIFLNCCRRVCTVLYTREKLQKFVP